MRHFCAQLQEKKYPEHDQIDWVVSLIGIIKKSGSYDSLSQNANGALVISIINIQQS